MTSQQANREAPPVEVRVHDQGIAIVTLRGEHDVSGQPAIGKALAQASEQPHVLVDLSECSFMDSSVLATVLAARENLQEQGGRLEAIIPPEASFVHRLAKLMGLDQLVPIHESQGAALRGVAPGSAG